MHYLWLCIVCLGLAAFFIAVERTERYIEADVIKGIASVVFVIVGILSMRYADPDADVSYLTWIIIGLLVGAVADVLLNLRYVFEGNRAKIAFLSGILVFLLGHIAYLIAVMPRCPYVLPSVVLGVALTAVLMWWIFKHIEAEMTLKLFGIVYVGAITLLNVVALFVLVAHPSKHTAMFFAGTLLFLISDVILILNTFGRESRFSLRVANLMLYYVGQLLIALSIQLPM